jgi:magnesium-transporting ATPase (P-type)
MKTLSNQYNLVQSIDRESLENNLEFLGLLVMENRLKPETKPVIDLLNRVNIRVIMCTGDNILTGLCVAKFCNILGEDSVVALVEAESNEMPRFKFSKIIDKKISEIKVVDYQVCIFFKS